jgi:hypothetical protein
MPAQKLDDLRLAVKGPDKRLVGLSQGAEPLEHPADQQ